MVAAGLLLATSPAFADRVQSLDKGVLFGKLTISNGQDVVVTGEDGKAVKLKLEDIERITLGKQMASSDGDMLLINNDKGQVNAASSKVVKLRAGLHRFAVPYWQGEGTSKLELTVSGPGINQLMPIGEGHMYCFRSASAKHEPSAGIDAQGFRLPELDLKSKDNRRVMQDRCRYRLYAAPENSKTPFQNVGVLTQIPLKMQGTINTVDTKFVSDPQNRFGIVFEGFFVAKKDGSYTFRLLNDDGAQLYLGEAQKFIVDALGSTPVHAPWNFTLRHAGSARGELKGIADEQTTIHIPLVSDTTLDNNQIKSMWDARIDLSEIDLSKTQQGMDTVYVRDKKEPTKLVPIAGKLVALDKQSLSFEFRGKARTIARERVAGLVLDHTDRPAPADPGFYQLAELRGGQMLPCRFESLDEHARLQLIGGGKVAPPRDVLVALTCENGRRVDLTRVPPTAEEAIPYFGTELPSRVNRSFADQPIKLFDDKVYTRGLAVHSKSRLHFKLSRPAETFKARFGLLNPGGKLGDVTARVLGDGKVLWEQTDITANTKPIDVTVALAGIQRLVLEVDFGKNQNVGDRAAWCEPQLIYAANADND